MMTAAGLPDMMVVFLKKLVMEEGLESASDGEGSVVVTSE
jgi:hypothetical protein